MKISLKTIGKKAALGMTAAVVAVTGATAAVFAQIPHSTTGVISACRANSDGTVRLIDTQANGVCEQDETAVSWASAGDGDSSHSALARLVPNPQDPLNYVLDSTRSRNVVNVKTVDLDPENSIYRMLCIQLTFSPETSDAAAGIDGAIILGQQAVEPMLKAQGGWFEENVVSACGSEYHVGVYMYDTNPVGPQAISFAN